MRRCKQSASQMLLLAITLLLCFGWAAGQAGNGTVPAPGVPAPAPAPANSTAPAVANGPAALGNGTSADGGKLIICVVDWEPIAMCKSQAQYNPANFSGHDVAMVRDAAALLGLREGEDWELRCDSFSTMVRSLTNTSGPCSAAASGVTITTEREASGIKFTYPYYKSSLSTLVQAHRETSDGWGFTRPFSWDLWLALFITLLVFPPIIFIVEFLSLRKAIHRGDVAPGVVESAWRGAITLMLMDSFPVTSQGARVAVLCFIFLALLVTSTYTANLAAFVTVNTIAARITSVADLRGRAVGTSPIYIERLQKYGIQGIPYPLSDGSDYLAWRDLVSTGQLSALVRDTPALEWLANTAPLCDVVVLPQQIEPFDYGIAFHSNASGDVVDSWGRAILRLQEDGTLQQLRDSWIVSSTTGCQVNSQVNRNALAVGFKDLAGLWIILGAGIAAGVCIMVGQRYLRRYRKRHGLDTGDTAPSGGARGPLPDERRTNPLLSSVAAWGKRSRRMLSMRRLPSGGRRDRERDVSVHSDKSAAKGLPGERPDSAHTTGGGGGGSPLSPKPSSLAVQGCTWDLESAPSGSLPAGGDATPLGSAAHTPAAALPAPQMAQLQRTLSGAPAANSAREQPEAGAAAAPRVSRRISALEVADSIYAVQRWKSQLKTGSGPRAAAG